MTTLSISNPKPGTTVSETIDVVAAVTGVTRVNFSVDGLVKVRDTAAPFTFKMDTKLYSNGTHTIKAVSGNGKLSATVNVLVSNVVPPVIVIPPPVIPPPDTSGYPASFFTGPLKERNMLPPFGKKWLSGLMGGQGYTLDMQDAQREQREAAMEKKFPICHYHIGGGGYWDGVFGAPPPNHAGATREERAFSNGSECFITWTPDINIGQMLAGAADPIWKKMGAYWGSLTPHRIMCRAFHEFDLGFTHGIDGPGGPYSAAQFKQAWARMVEVIHSAGGTNVGFCWCPFEGGSRGGTRTWLASHWPGDYLVDWASSDIYNHRSGWSSPLHENWAEWVELFNYSAMGAGCWSGYDIFSSGKAVNGQKGITLPAGLPAKKPFMVGETSTPYEPAAPNKKGDWFRQVNTHQYGIKSMENMIGISFYDSDVHAVGGDYDWRIDSNASVGGVLGQSDAASLAGWAEMAKDSVWV